MQIQFCRQAWEVVLWNGEDPPVTPICATDTETEELVDGQPIKPVIGQFCFPRLNKVVIVPFPHAREYLAKYLGMNPTGTVVFHTFAFDYRVFGGSTNKELTSILVAEFHTMMADLLDSNVKAAAALADKRPLTVDETTRFNLLLERYKVMPDAPGCGRIVDVSLRAVLAVQREGGLIEDTRLETLSFKFLGERLVKDDDLRLSFKQGEPLSEGQMIYAAKDSIATALLYDVFNVYEATETTQLLADIVLKEISARGMFVDKEVDDKLHEKFEKEIKGYRDEETGKWVRGAEEILNIYGYYEGEEGNTSKLQSLLRNIERRSGIMLPRSTKQKDKYGRRLISCSKKAIMSFPSFNGRSTVPKLIAAYKKFTHLRTMLGVFCNRAFTKLDGAVHTQFSCILKTGRTGSKKPPMQNPPKGDGIRQRYKARPGHVLCATDYSQVELCTLAQTCFRRYYASVMLEKINSNVGLHELFGEAAKKIAKNCPPKTDFRQMAKAQ